MNGGYSEIPPKPVLMLFFCTVGMCYLPFLLYMHLEFKKVMIAWSSYCNKWSVTHKSGTFVRTWKSLHFCLDCSSGTLNFLVSCVSGTACTRHITMSKGMACQKDFGARTQKCKASFTGWVIEDFVANSSCQVWSHEEFCEGNCTAFLYLRQKFPLLSDAKIREGVFTGSDIRSLLRH